MRWTVAVQVGEGHVPCPLEGGNVIDLRIDTESTKRRISHKSGRDDTWTLLDRCQLKGTPDAAVDLFRFAAVVYSIDRRLPRKKARDAWSRHIELHLPVLEVGPWRGAQKTVEKLLRFLTGDVWELRFYPGQSGRPPPSDRLRKTYEPLDATSVCLLSGGLDSFIGAADALADDEQLYLVSHNEGKYTKSAQSKLVRAFKGRFGGDRIRHIQESVTPPSEPSLQPIGLPTGSEESMRSRSLLFFSLGVLVTASLENAQRLLVPENGLITINPPLVPSRAGSHSTRTTHPFTVQLFERLLEALALEVDLVLQYQFMTKGEMLEEATDRNLVESQTLNTVSCGKANWTAMEAKRQGLGGVNHCGGCVPCIIRRAALNAAGITGERYVLEDLNANPSSDVRDFRIALERFRQNGGPSLPDVLETGPIPPDQIPDYLDVVERGLREVSRLLR